MKKIKITNHNIPSRHSTLYTYYRLTSISNLQNSFREVKKRGNSMFTLSTQTLTINKINVYVIRHKFFLKKIFSSEYLITCYFFPSLQTQKNLYLWQNRTKNVHKILFASADVISLEEVEQHTRAENKGEIDRYYCCCLRGAWRGCAMSAFFVG